MQVLPAVRIPTRVVIPTLMPEIFEPKLMPRRPQGSVSSRAEPKNVARKSSASRSLLELRPVCVRPTTVITGASTKYRSALGAEGASYNIKMAESGTGGCRPEERRIVEGKRDPPAMREEPAREVASVAKETRSWRP